MDNPQLGRFFGVRKYLGGKLNSQVAEQLNKDGHVGKARVYVTVTVTATVTVMVSVAVAVALTVTVTVAVTVAVSVAVSVGVTVSLAPQSSPGWAVPPGFGEGGIYRSSVDAREPQNPTNSEEYQGHLH
eukprot:478601-Prorocentrum_minimum.AAC.1